MKEFRMELASPPQGVYFPGMLVTGTVICVTEKPEDYKQIVVTLDGGARVHWSESSGTGENRRTDYYTSTEHYMNAQAVVWDNASVGGGKFPVGSFRFDFSLQLPQGIPPSYTGRYGHITYTLEARVVNSGVLKQDVKAVTNLNIGSIVQSTSPQLMQPLSGEVRKTLCCCCCESGPIVMTARIPRTGFCLGRDAIPVEITVTNGSSRQINNIRVSLQKTVIYYAQGRHKYDKHACVAYNTRPVAPRESTSLQLEPMQVPADIVPTLENYSQILNVKYYVTVSGEVSYAFSPYISLPVVIGNVDASAGGGANPQPPTYPGIAAGGNLPAPPIATTTWEPPPSYPSDPVPLGFDAIKN